MFYSMYDKKIKENTVSKEGDDNDIDGTSPMCQR